MYAYIYIYIYTYTCLYMYTCIYIYIYIYREREREIPSLHLASARVSDARSGRSEAYNAILITIGILAILVYAIG